MPTYGLDIRLVLPCLVTKDNKKLEIESLPIPITRVTTFVDKFLIPSELTSLGEKISKLSLSVKTNVKELIKLDITKNIQLRAKEDMNENKLKVSNINVLTRANLIVMRNHLSVNKSMLYILINMAKSYKENK